VTDLEGDLEAPPLISDPSGASVTDPPFIDGGSVIVVDPPSGASVTSLVVDPSGAPVVVVVVDPSGAAVAVVVPPSTIVGDVVIVSIVGDGSNTANVGLTVGIPDVVGALTGSPVLLISAPTVINASFISSHTYRRYSLTSGPGSSSGPVPFVRIPTSPSPAVQHPLRIVNLATALLLLFGLSRPAG
jgi:hypothetical protein